MTAEKTTAKSEGTPEENGVVDAVTHLVETLAKNAEDLRGRLTKLASRVEALQNARIDAADVLNSSGKTVTDGVVAFDTEVLKFAEVSAKEGLDAVRAVVNAKSPEVVVRDESKYLQKHLTASIDAGRKLVEICAENGRNAMKPITRSLSAAAKKENGSKAAAQKPATLRIPSFDKAGPGVKLVQGQHQCARPADAAEKDLHERA